MLRRVRSHTAFALTLTGLFSTPSIIRPCHADENSRPRIIRPPDDRADYFAVDAELQRIGDAVCAFVTSDMITKRDDGTFEINAATLAQDQSPLCPDEPFGDQPTAAVCTGTLIASDIVVTAGHCLDNNGVRTPGFDEFYFVFDYAVREDGVFPSQFSADQVYQGAEVLGLVNESGTANDWAVVRLDRDVTGRTPVGVRLDGEIAVGQAVLAVGFGAGLPMKFSGNATVQDIIQFGFEADLDIIEGNSGGPIINRNTLLIEGVVSSDLDASDFYMDGNCNRATVCPGDPICSEGFTSLAAVTIAEFNTAIVSALTRAGGGGPPTNNGGSGDDDGGFGPVGPCGAVGLIPFSFMLIGLALLRRS